MLNPLRILALTSLVVALGVVVGCRRGVDAPPSAERAVLERRTHELETLLERVGDGGRLVPFEQAVLVIDQSVLQGLVTAALPYEMEAVGGSVRLRILEATVTCDDGVALVDLMGRASFAAQPESTAFAEAHVFGVLDEFDLKPEERILRSRLHVIGLDVPQVKGSQSDHVAIKGLLRDLGRIPVEALRGPQFVFDIPVRMVDDIRLPAFESRGGVEIAEARIPLDTKVTNVTALGGRLWISLRLVTPDSLVSTPLAVRAEPEGRP